MCNICLGQVAIPTLTQLPSDADSSDLELEDVVPAEVLKDHHRRKIIVAEDKPDGNIALLYTQMSSLSGPVFSYKLRYIVGF